jgi:hypothetical protein
MAEDWDDPPKTPQRKRRDDDDDYDDDDRPRRRNSSGGGGGVDYVVPYKNMMALLAYYFGVFGLISCFLFGVGGLFGIVPIILGVLGLMKASKNPEAHGSVHAWVGIGLGALEMLVGLGATGFILYGIFTARW